MAETTFSIAYDGPALASGRMPVRDLAPALLALGDVFALASGVLEPQLEPVAVNVEATREGSFLVHLVVEAEASWDQFVSLFSSKDASALLNLVEVIAGGSGLIALIKRLSGHAVSAVERPADPGMIRLKLDDQTSIEVPVDAWTLYRKVEMRRHAREVVAPLGRPGIDSIRLTTTESEIIVSQDDLDAFTVDEDETAEALLDTEQEMYVEVVAPTFFRSNKWRLNLGGFVFWARMLDEDFLDRVEQRQEVFGAGDVLKVRVSMTQTRDADGLHTAYTIIEVLDHLRKPQLSLDD